ncbi:MAG TPA: PEGA domain-containing protein [Myxococcota bacterium]|nr:PEGA domain-containing protein [Myxococcota bacterium]
MKRVRVGPVRAAGLALVTGLLGAPAGTLAAAPGAAATATPVPAATTPATAATLPASLTPLRVDSSPAGAVVLVDGVNVGMTPYVGAVPPGAHRVMLALEDHEPGVAELIAVGEPLALTMTLPPSAAARSLTAPKPRLKRPALLEGEGDGGEAAAMAARPLPPYPNPRTGTALALALPFAGALVGTLMIAPREGSAGDVAGATLLLASLAIGPSAGHIYGGLWGPSLAHSAIRVAAGGLGTFSGVLALVGAFAGDPYLTVGGAAVFFVSGGAWLGDIIYEWITTAKDLRRERKRRAGAEARPALSLLPGVPSPSGRLAPGATLTIAGW